MRAVRLREHSRKEAGEEKRGKDEKVEERNELISQLSSGQAYRCIFAQPAPVVDVRRDKHIGTTDLRKRRICHIQTRTKTRTRASIHCECIYTYV